MTPPPARGPEPLRPRLVDTHCHLAHLGGDPGEALRAAAAAGVGPVVDVAMGLAESEEAVRRAEELRGQVWVAVGIHPNALADFRADPAGCLARLRELGRREVVVAVGETGLDRYRDREAPTDQELAFAAHIALAKELGKALVVHCRDAQARVLEVLDAEGAPDRVVMHCFSGGPEHARACAERGFFCSFAGNLTYPRNAALREAARVVPEELLLVETDAPFLPPQPFRGRTNTPALLPHTAEALARARGQDLEGLLGPLARNARRAFGLPQAGG